MGKYCILEPVCKSHTSRIFVNIFMVRLFLIKYCEVILKRNMFF
jgi:hypothetical protein